LARAYRAADGSERRNWGGVLKEKISGGGVTLWWGGGGARAEGEGSDVWVWVCKISKKDTANCGSSQYSERGGAQFTYTS
jgi:hypothetical protein